MLVKYGYYANLNDIHALMEPLISLLNGKNDKSHSGANSENFSGFNKVHTAVPIYVQNCDYVSNNIMLKKRYEDTPENRAVFNLKIKALKIMDLFFNFRIFLRLQVWNANNFYLISLYTSFYFFSTSSGTTNY